MRNLEDRRRKERRAKIDSGLLLIEATKGNKRRADNNLVSNWTKRFHQLRGSLQK